MTTQSQKNNNNNNNKQNMYTTGEKVNIVRGKYRGFQGTYICKHGTVMCSVTIDGNNGDEKRVRHLWLSSIEHSNGTKFGEENHEHNSKKKGKKKKREEAITAMIITIEGMKQQLDCLLSTLDDLLLNDDEDD